MYRLLDSGNFQKLEQIGPYRVVRPAAQAVWKPRLGPDQWRDIDASFARFSSGDGKWEIRRPRLPESWQIETAFGRMLIRLTDFGHLGIFPEQNANWQRLAAAVEQRVAAKQEVQVLNLFAYTGGSSLACAGAGAAVAHVDASKTSVAWARENAELSGLQACPVRWLVDDVQKFVQRELRRGSRYHGVILDPPSFGRGPKGETWKIEEMLPTLLADLKQLLASDYLFILLSSHSAGYTPLALVNLMGDICDTQSGKLSAEEMTVREEASGRALPSGASCLFVRA